MTTAVSGLNRLQIKNSCLLLHCVKMSLRALLKYPEAAFNTCAVKTPQVSLKALETVESSDGNSITSALMWLINSVCGSQLRCCEFHLVQAPARRTSFRVERAKVTVI